MEPPVHRAGGGWPSAARSCVHSSEGRQRLRPYLRGKRCSFLSDSAQRHAKPLGKGAWQHLPPAFSPPSGSCVGLAPVSCPAHSHCPATSVSSFAPSVCLKHPTHGSSSVLRPGTGRAGALGVLPPPSRHTQSQLTPEQGALSSSLLRAPSYRQLSAV